MSRTVAEQRPDIETRADISRLVVEFYTRAFADPLIGSIFTDIAHLDLDAHLPIMCDFWESVLFHSGVYRRNALALHRDLNSKFPLLPAHFDRWVEIWTATVDDQFTGTRAEFAKRQAAHIAANLSRRMAEELEVAAPVTLPVTIPLRAAASKA